jgi:hypothetical protein
VDSLWLQNTLVPALISAAVLLLVLWPTRSSGTRVLKNWGIGDPVEPQVTEAVRYLRRRRFLTVVLFLVLPPLAGLLWPAPDDTGVPGNLFVPLLAAMLIAELIATLRPVGGVRVASLDRRTWRDLVPRCAIGTMLALTALAVTFGVLGLVAQPWVNRYVAALPPDGVPQPPDDWTVDLGEETRAILATPTGWRVLAGVAVCLAVVGALVFLAVRRPSVSDAAVDFSLRTRTARVGVGIGFGWLAGLVNDGQERLSYLRSVGEGGLPLPPRPGWLSGDFVEVTEAVAFGALIVAIVCWMWVAMPSRRSLARAPR